MAKGILLVRTRPNSPEDADAYHRWYEETHIPEMLALDGVVAARRLEAIEGGSFIAIYDVDDIDAARAAMADARSSGSMSHPIGVQLDPPPVIEWYRDLASSQG